MGRRGDAGWGFGNHRYTIHTSGSQPVWEPLFEKVTTLPGEVHKPSPPGDATAGNSQALWQFQDRLGNSPDPCHPDTKLMGPIASRCAFPVHTSISVQAVRLSSYSTHNRTGVEAPWSRVCLFQVSGYSRKHTSMCRTSIYE